MRRLWPLLLLLLAACAPRLSGVNPERPPSPEDWGPKPAPVEWWYVSAYLPREGLAFHWAFFKFWAPEGTRILGLPYWLIYPYPLHASHLAITDLKNDRLIVREKHDFPSPAAVVRGDPLVLKLDDWTLRQTADGFVLDVGPLRLRLWPLKPAVVHPPGYSGTAETGRMYYVSYTRLGLEGRVLGRPVAGYARMDHQWGEQMAGYSARWDWFGLRLSNFAEVMLYRIRDAKGRVVAIHADYVDPEGRARKLERVRMTPLGYWTSPVTGYRYAVAWRVEAKGLDLTLRPLRLAQEIRSGSTRVVYWEGPEVGEGVAFGERVRAEGMGEFVGGPWPR